MRQFLLALLVCLVVVFVPFRAKANGGGPELPLHPDAIVASDAVDYLGGGPGGVAMGEFSWSLPVWAPPGRNGSPGLAVTYGSRSGNGLLGVGFSLSGLPEIHRCGRSYAVDSVTSGVDFSSADRFCVAGQRLIVVKGAYGAGGSEYRLERDGFDKFVFHEGSIFVPSFFEVFTKDGRIATYEALKVNRAKPSPSPPYAMQAFDYVDALWVLVEVKTRAGDRTKYDHARVTFPDQPDQFTIEHMPERIQYTLRPGDIDGEREVRFVYEDRPDPSFTYLSGVRIKQTKRLKAIELYAPNPTAKGLVGSYHFTYLSSTTTGRSLLDTIKRCDGASVCLWGKAFEWQNAARPAYDAIDLGIPEFPPGFFDSVQDTGIVVFDADGDGKDEVLYRTGWDYYLRRMDAGKTPLGERIWIDPIESMGGFGIGFENVLLNQSRPVDLNTDGADELWASQPLPVFGYHVFDFKTATGQPASTGKYWPAALLQNGNDIFLEAVQFGDADGDGQLDLFHQETDLPDYWYWKISLNSGGEIYETINAPIDGYCGRSARILDVDGDGRAEVWSSSNVGCTESITAGLGSDGKVHVEGQAGLGFEAKRAQFADLNGDGLRDLVRPGSPSGWVRFSTGMGYGPKEDLVDGPYPDPNATGSMDQGTYVADLNGDSREDILAFRYAPSPTILAYLSKGDGSFDTVDLNIWPGSFHASEGFTTSRIGDFNGDGLIDIVEVGPDGHMYVLVQKPGVVDVVNGIRDHLVAEQAREVIVYSNQWSDDPEPASCTFPQRCVRHGMPVVREHWRWQGADVGAYQKTLYSYEDPRVDLIGRGFLGYGKVRAWDPDRLRETVTTFDHTTRAFNAYPFAGLPKTVTVTAPILEEPPAAWPASARARVVKIEHAYFFNLLNQFKTHFVPPLSFTSDEWEQDVSVKPDGIELPNNANKVDLRHREGSFEFDDYGNRTYAKVWTQGGVQRTIDQTYEIREDDWLISLPLTAKVTSIPGGVDPTPGTRETHFKHDDLGYLESIHVEPNAPEPNQRLTTSFRRNQHGLVDRIAWEAPGEATRFLHIAYDEQDGIFPSRIWNELGFVELFAYHPAYGVLAASADIDGVITRNYFDGFGRLRRVETDGEAAEDLWYAPRVEGPWIRGLIEGSQSETGAEIFHISDELGRPVEEAWRGFDGQWVHAGIKRDLLGRVTFASRPAIGAPPSVGTTYRHDSLDRPLEAKEADGATTTHKHSFFELTTWDPKQNETRTKLDVDGRIIERIDFLDGEPIPTTYSYGAFDRIEEVHDAKGNVTLLGYDVRGRRTSLVDPDRGATSFLYNGFDELVWEQNALAQTTTYDRDVLGRVTEKIDADGINADSITTYIYDTGPGALGKLSHVAGPDGTTTDLLYDALGRPATAKWTIQGNSYVVGRTYDPFGRLADVTYPEVPNRAPFTVEHTYNPFGYLEEIRDKAQGDPFWTVTGRNADGALTSSAFGNKVTEARAYYPLTGRLKTLQTLGAVELDALEYTYDANGNVHSRVDGAAKRIEIFGHDDLDRLTTWTLSTETGLREATYGYSVLGNLEKVHVNGKLEADNGYGENGEPPHALTSTLSSIYDYDPAGRMLHGGGRDIVYTAFDLPKTITQAGKVTEFGYDAFEQRVRKTTDAGTTIYVADLYERREKGAATEHVFRVHGESGVVAEVHFNDAAVPKEKTLYLHGDPLGSVRLVTNESGGEEHRFYFEPFGQRVEHDGSPSGPNFTPAVDVGFTGHQHDDDLGLINMRGRIYDPALRRFLTPDPLVAFPLFGQSFNRYSYALNSPLSFTDPTGFNPNKASGGWFYEGGPPVKLSVPRGLDGPARAVPKAPPKTAPRTPSATTSPSNSHSDGAEFKEPTGAAAAQDKAASSTPAPQVEAPSAPAVSAPAPIAAGGAAADVPVGPPPPESTGDPDGEPGTWRDSTVVQGVGGFVIGLGLGVVPFGGVVETGLSATGVIDAGTRAARIGLAVGEVIGGALLTAIGAGGSAASIALSATGLGAVAGVPALVGSAGLLTAGAGNVGAGLGGLWQALTTGGGAESGVKPPLGTAGGRRAGERFTPKDKRTVIDENRQKYGGNTRCENCKTHTAPGQKSQRGVSPPRNETNVDHVFPRARGGDGSPLNGQVLCRTCNRQKSDKVP